MNDWETGDGLTIYKDEASEKKAAEPPKYAITLHNDHSTDPGIVIHVLEEHIRIGADAAHNIMMEAHTTGKAVCGLYTKDMAETLVNEAMMCYAVQGTELTFTVDQA